MTNDRVIGKWDKLPWDIPDEMKNFRAFTLDKTIVMGRKTYEGLGRPLPRRRNIMMTRNPESVQIGSMETLFENGAWKCKWKKRDIEIVTCTEELEQMCLWETEILILGGAQIYSMFLGKENTELRISHIHDTYSWDIYFPEYSDLYQEYDRYSYEEFDVVNYRLQKSSR